MATKHYIGGAPLQAQVISATITNPDVATIFKLTIGDETVSATGAASASGTATALAAAFQAAAGATGAHPHISAISAAASGAAVRLTADVPGVAFDPVTSGATGGSGTIGAAAITTVNKGPSDWRATENWSDGAIPANGDVVTIKGLSQPILYGLGQSAVKVAKLIVEQSFDGKIGLPALQFSKDVNGESVTGVREYRQQYLDIGADEVEIGADFGIASLAGSSRIKLDNAATGTSKTTIFNTGAVAAETGLPAVRLLFNSVNADLYVRRAPGGVGVAVDVPGEASTLGDVNVSTESGNDRVITGAGVVVASFNQQGGNNLLQASSGVSSIILDGGTLRTEGDFQVTDIFVRDGILIPNHVSSASGDEIGTLEAQGGLVDYTQSAEPRSLATLKLLGGDVEADAGVLTIGAIEAPAEGRYTLSSSD